MSSHPTVSVIVSVAAAMRFLPCMLWSLYAQVFTDFEVIVTDSTNLPQAMEWNRLQVERMNDCRFKYLHVGAHNCYLCAHAGVEAARGNYLCFPCDDEYYTPGFLDIMIRTAQSPPSTPLVYCDVVADPRCSLHRHLKPHSGQKCAIPPGTWFHYSAVPEVGGVTKGGILITRELFNKVGGFPGAEHGIGSDGFMFYRASQHATPKKAPGVLWVHN